MTRITIEEITADRLESVLEDLAEILHVIVNDGASVGFILPYSQNESRAFWLDTIFPHIKQGGRHLLVAKSAGRVVGTVQLAVIDMPNQTHRADVAKLLVHPSYRNRGIAKMLMMDLEVRARKLNKGLLTLDTRTGDIAEPLYAALGYKTAGAIPGYCRAPDADIYESTTYMYKAL